MLDGTEANDMWVLPPITSISAGPAAAERHVQDVDLGHLLEQLGTHDA